MFEEVEKQYFFKKYSEHIDYQQSFPVPTCNRQQLRGERGFPAGCCSTSARCHPVHFTGTSQRGRHHAVIGPRHRPVALLDIRLSVLNFHPAAVRGIFLAVGRRHMRRIVIEIRPSNSELLAVGIDPFPEIFSGGQSLRPCRAFDAHDIGRKPMAIAAMEAPAVVGPVIRRLQAACDRLTVVIAERAGDARRQPGLFRRAKRMIELHLEARSMPPDRRSRSTT